MSETITDPTAPETKPVAKTAPKAAPKAAKKANKPGKPANGLRGNQVRVLEVLAKKNGLTRSEIAEKTGIDQASLTELIGSHEPARRAANDKKHFPSLVGLKLVRHVIDEEKGITHEIMAAGRKAVAK